MSVFDTVDQYVSWPPSKFDEPRAVAHGIQLKKSLAEIAVNWWSQRWLKIIDEFGLGVRWERAKLYASRGQVASIDIENGLVTASVQGSGDEPYRVMLRVKTIPKVIWSNILADLGRTSSFAIGVSSGKLPPEQQISQVFQDNGVLLFPDRQGELHTKCTCLDWSNPCKHIAAVYLLLGAEFDRDPFLLFKLRGLEPSELFKLLPAQLVETAECNAEVAAAAAYDAAPMSELRNGNHMAICLDSSIDSSITDTSHDRAGRETRLSEHEFLRHFWGGPLNESQAPGAWNFQPQTASLPASLGEFPFWQGNEDLLDRIRCAYESAPEYAKNALSRRNSLF